MRYRIIVRRKSGQTSSRSWPIRRWSIPVSSNSELFEPFPLERAQTPNSAAVDLYATPIVDGESIGRGSTIPTSRVEVTITTVQSAVAARQRPDRERSMQLRIADTGPKISETTHSTAPRPRRAVASVCSPSRRWSTTTAEPSGSKPTTRPVPCSSYNRLSPDRTRYCHRG